MICLKLSKTNIYLIHTPNGLLQFDTGYDHDWPLYISLLKKAGYTPASIQFLALSHHHDDHTGFVRQLTEVNPSVRVIMNSLCAQLMLAGHNARQFGGGWCTRRMKLLAEFYRRVKKNWTLTFPSYSSRPQDIIWQGNTYSLGPITGADLTMISTPGHSPDSCCLASPDGRIFCGDTASRYLLWAGTAYCPPFVTSLEILYQSWQVLLNLGARTIHPAHGKPFSAQKLRNQSGRLKTENMGVFIWD